MEKDETPDDEALSNLNPIDPSIDVDGVGAEDSQ
jgi:hypothetical protein